MKTHENLELSIFFMTENFLFSGDTLQRLNEAPLEPWVTA